MLSSAEKGDGLRRRVNSARLAVAAPAVRLAFGMRRASRWRRPGLRRPGLRRRLMVAVSAVAVLSFGTGVTLAVAGTSPPGPIASGPFNAAQVATVNRAAAAAWIAGQLDSGITVSCDPQMCARVRKAGLPSSRLITVPSSAGAASSTGATSSAGAALGSGVVVATLAIRDQFGSRLATIDAPLVIASFGSGANRVDVRAVAPDGAAALRASLAAGHTRLISAGAELLANKNIQASPAARAALLAGQVDPRLLVTLSALASDTPLRLVTFDGSSPGASPAIPLRGAEFGAASPAGLSAALTFLRAQQSPYRPAGAAITRSTGGQSLVMVRFDAQGVPDVGGI
jgi:hypothetical protein